jgi:hypothetical protein
MRERAEPILKIVCLILATLVLYQFAGIFLRMNPLHGVVVPALPALTANTNNAPENGRNGNSAPIANAVKSTNNVTIAAGTNISSTLNTNKISNTNSISSPTALMNGSNSIALEKIVKTETNLVSHSVTNANGTNFFIAQKPVEKGTNRDDGKVVGQAFSLSSSSAQNTNTTGKMPIPLAVPAMARSGRNFNPFQSQEKRADVPPAIQAQISKITDSEILGPVIRPLPMALMGIAGDVAFLRSPSGQTGLVKVGDSLGEIKLLRIGINRVLVELDGQQQELMIFSGYGGESLLSKPGGTNDEIHIQ